MSRYQCLSFSLHLWFLHLKAGRSVTCLLSCICQLVFLSQCAKIIFRVHIFHEDKSWFILQEEECQELCKGFWRKLIFCRKLVNESLLLRLASMCSRAWDLVEEEDCCISSILAVIRCWKKTSLSIRSFHQCTVYNVKEEVTRGRKCFHHIHVSRCML